jgi:2-keto-4-pentenoate hydratase/2-oxohepta-3-ene-1,7-dioic acid hydratase in catechol pathway
VTDYKLLSFTSGGRTRAGILVDGLVHDLADLTGVEADSTVLGALQDWPATRPRVEQAAARAAKERGAGQPVEGVQLAAPVLYPSTVYCAGANYNDHDREMSKASGREPDPSPKAVGLSPWHFLKPARTVVADNETVWLPRASKAVDWEVELVAVIGRPARDVSIETALDYVAGYTVAIDLSARDLSRRPPLPEGSPFFYDWSGHKGFEGSCPLGPWITPSAQIGDPQNLKLGLRVNGVVKQDSSTAEMIFNTAEQIAHLSSLRTLYPGDIVLTGTPAGVGAARREFLKPGDSIEAWIEGIGSLRTPIGPA